MVSKQSPTPDLETNLSQLSARLQKAIAQPQAKLQLKLRGNILHILCITPAPLEQETMLLRLVQALLGSDFKTLLSDRYSKIYQFYIYSRSSEQAEPDWSAPLYLNRLEKHLVQLTEPLRPDLEGLNLGTEAPQGSEGPQAAEAEAAQALSDAIVLSNLSLARRGDPEAIARYLSQTLSRLGIGVWVSIRAIPGKGKPIASAITAHHDAPDYPVATSGVIERLWILCEAAYSPDPDLVAEPTAQQLRHLKLSQFQDAVIVVQVQGEQQPDWILRVDLTSRVDMLRAWARWGDAEAIAGLVEQTLEPLAIAASTELKSTTLHILCQLKKPDPGKTTPEAATTTALTTLLEGLAPQGLHRAILYGQSHDQNSPDWIHWLDLPAQEHPALAEPAEALAQQGDLPALAFILTRQLNPSLDQKLATGGIQVQLLVKDKLLHIMLDAPVCPAQRSTTRLVPYVQQLRLEGIEGIRLYGRRAGQKQPSWSYGNDFQPRDRVVPKAVPEFTASEAYLSDLLASDEVVLSPEDDSESLWATLGGLWQETLQTVRDLLFQTQLFEPGHDSSAASVSELPSSSSAKAALVWGTAGLLLVLQTDWLIGQMLNAPSNPATAEAMQPIPEPEPTASFESNGGSNNALEPEPKTAEDEWSKLKFGRQADEPAPSSSSADGFTDANDNLPYSDLERPLVASETLISASPFPTFRSQQLDEKLALYYQRLQASGPSDVLIIGSSRALRGIDPAALERSLENLGYSNISVFNFGVNGSTAQVVDFTIRQLLQPDQLPRLIIWADGARALNSGRVDVTYNGIAASEGYRQLQAGQISLGDADTEITSESASALATATSLRESYQAVDRWLNQQIAQVSAAYSDRDRLKAQLQQLAARWDPPVLSALQLGEPLPELEAEAEETLPDNIDLVDFDGFLALPVRFNPATYYQNHARVPGDYDSDYENFRLQGQQAQALETLLTFTQQQNIPVVFVNTPLTDEYLDASRLAAETEFSA